MESGERGELMLDSGESHTRMIGDAEVSDRSSFGSVLTSVGGGGRWEGGGASGEAYYQSI